MVIDVDADWPDELTVDVCIIGSGPAGLAIAGKFANSSVRVCVLEGGERLAGGDAKDVFSGFVDSPDGYHTETLHEGRARQLGGTANLWRHQLHKGIESFVRCLSLDEVDFEERAWVPESGWPFSKRELQPFYSRARSIFGVGGEESGVNGAHGGERQSWIAGELEPIVSHLGEAGAIWKNLVGPLAASPNVHFLLRADLRNLTLDPLSCSVLSAEAESSQGRRIVVRARKFVLAAGGLENPRILLLNDAQQNGGLGNQHDLVGRYFMDHPSITLGILTPSSPSLFDTSGFFDQHSENGHSMMGLLHIREDVMRREQMLNMGGALVPHFKAAHAAVPTFWEPAAREATRVVCRKVKNAYLKAFPRLDAAPPTSGRPLVEGCYEDNYTGWSRIFRKSLRFSVFSVRALVEQLPDAANRVMLDEARDRFGQRKIKLVWRWNEADLRSIRRGQAIFQRELAASGRGIFTPVEESAGSTPRPFWSPHHFMGTTRMHRQETRGVVDENCRVHGIQNLFISGSSVFPTGGFANPTLTIVALALRLADHLKERLSSDA